MYHKPKNSLSRLAALALGVIAATPWCFAEYNKIADQLEASLADKTTSADSIPVLTNIFDIRSTITGIDPIGAARRTYETAMRAEDYEVALEMLRNLANMCTHDAHELDTYLEMARTVSDGPHKDETITFIRLCRNTLNDNSYAPAEDNATHLEQRLSELTSGNDMNPYDRIVELHSIIRDIMRVSKGELMIKYINDLGDLVEQLPEEEMSIRNWFYVQAANVMAEINFGRESANADVALLRSVENLQKFYNTKGRPYRNYNGSKYVIYTRLLSNWEALDPEQVEEYYSLAKECMKKDSRARRSYEQSPDPEIYYSMYKKDYAKAHNLLKDAAFNPNTRLSRRMKFLKYLIEASQGVGDNATMLEASLAYNKFLEETVGTRVRERAKELQIVYDSYGLKDTMDENASRTEASIHKLQSSIIYICIGALVGLIALVVILIRQFRHSRKLTDTLFQSNLALEHESEALRASQSELQQARDNAEKANRFKTDFIKSLGKEISIPLNAVNEYANLIVDCATDEKKVYLQNYADQVEQNCEYLTTLMNDVFHLSEIDNDAVTIKPRLTDLRKIAEMALETVQHRVKPDVNVVLDPNAPSPIVYTDPRRLQQILTRLISNAIKYTETGEIFLSCKFSADNSKVEISVADSGPGIPSSQSERIFERFAKIDKDSPGLGIGLSIARMLARMLGGDLVLDTTYTKGARFILSIPNKNK